MKLKLDMHKVLYHNHHPEVELEINLIKQDTDNQMIFHKIAMLINIMLQVIAAKKEHQLHLMKIQDLFNTTDLYNSKIICIFINIYI